MKKYDMCTYILMAEVINFFSKNIVIGVLRIDLRLTIRHKSVS